jgi:hypothetical protein
MPDQTSKEEARPAPAASLAGAQRRRPGELVPGSMRRIGLRHAVVTAPVRAELVDVGKLTNDLAVTTDKLARARALVALLETERAQLETKIAQFSAAPIERVDGDPDVPLTADPPDPPEDVSPADPKPAPSPKPAPGKRG